MLEMRFLSKNFGSKSTTCAHGGIQHLDEEAEIGCTREPSKSWT